MIPEYRKEQLKAIIDANGLDFTLVVISQICLSKAAELKLTVGHDKFPGKDWEKVGKMIATLVSKMVSP